MSQLSAFGVNLTPPNPVSYNISSNLGNIAGVIKNANDAQNQANQANNQRYGQMLGVLGNASTGQQGFYNQAQQQLGTGYDSAVGSLGNSLANNKTVFDNENSRVANQAQQASSAAQQSAISRGLGNTTITNSMQDQVTRAANDAYANTAAAKAQSDNGVYQNLANLYAAKGNAGAGLSAQQGQAYMGDAGTIANAIQGRTDAAPSLSEYASLIQAAQAANNSKNKSVISTTNPIPINSPLNGGGGIGTASGGGGISGGIASSMGGGGFNGGGAGGSGSSSGSPAPVTNPGGQIMGMPSSGLSSFPGSGTPGAFPAQSGGSGSTPPVPTFGGMGGGSPAEATTPAAPDGSGNEPGQGNGRWVAGGPGIDGMTGQWSPFARSWIPA